MNTVILTLCFLVGYNTSTVDGITVQEEISQCQGFAVPDDSDEESVCNYTGWFQTCIEECELCR